MTNKEVGSTSSSQRSTKQTPLVANPSHCVTNGGVGAGQRRSAGPLTRGMVFVLWDVKSTKVLIARTPLLAPTALVSVGTRKNGRIVCRSSTTIWDTRVRSSALRVCALPAAKLHGCVYEARPTPPGQGGAAVQEAFGVLSFARLACLFACVGIRAIQDPCGTGRQR